MSYGCSAKLQSVVGVVECGGDIGCSANLRGDSVGLARGGFLILRSASGIRRCVTAEYSRRSGANNKLVCSRIDTSCCRWRRTAAGSRTTMQATPLAVKSESTGQVMPGDSGRHSLCHSVESCLLNGVSMKPSAFKGRYKACNTSEENSLQPRCEDKMFGYTGDGLEMTHKRGIWRIEVSLACCWLFSGAPIRPGDRKCFRCRGKRARNSH